MYIVYELDAWSRDLNYFTYCSGFDSRSEFSLPDNSMGENSSMFGVDMSSPVHIDNKEKDILIFGKGPTQ